MIYMNTMKKIIIGIFIIMCLFSVSSVCASDVNDIVNVNQSDDIIYDGVTADVSIVADHNESLVSEYDNHNGWDDLDKDIQNLQPGDVYNIKQDYIKPDNASVIGINIKADNITINGNGHVINGNINNILKTSLFPEIMLKLLI